MFFSGSGLQQLAYAEGMTTELSNHITDSESETKESVSDTNTGETEQDIVSDTVLDTEPETTIDNTEESKKSTEVLPKDVETETLTEEQKTEEEQISEEVLKPKETQASELAKTADIEGLLEMGLPTGIDSFVPNKGTAVELNYTPRKEGTTKKIVISGYLAAGMQVLKPDTLFPYIKSVSTTDDSLTLLLAPINAGSRISIRIPILNATSEAGEVNFSKGITVADGVTYSGGLTVTEYVDETPDQTIVSKVPITFELTESDLKTKTDDSYTTDPGKKFLNGMTLYTNVETANDGGSNGKNWISQEGEYGISPLGYYSGNDVSSNSISPRYIQNLRLEIPLPPGVTFVNSPLETKTDGVLISASADRQTIYYERDEYMPKTEIKFRMTLDYSGIYNGSDSLTTKDINDWFNLYSNDTSITQRHQNGKSWGFSGIMYGVPVQKRFYDRSVLVLDSVVNYVSDKPFELDGANRNYIEEWGETIRINGDLKNGSKEFSVPTPNLGSMNHNYTRQAVFTMESAIQLKFVEFTSDNITEQSSDPTVSGTVKLLFYTNTGNVFEEVKREGNSVSAPFVDTYGGEYIEKLVVQATGTRTVEFGLMVELQPWSLDGEAFEDGYQSKITVYYGIENYGIVQPQPVEGKVVYTGTFTYLTTPSIPSVDRGGRMFITDYEYSDVDLIKVSNDGGSAGYEGIKPLKNVSVDIQVPSIVGDNEVYWVYQMLGNSTASLELANYSNGEYPDVKIIYSTSKGKRGEIVVGKSQFEGNATPKLNFNLPEGEFVSGLGIEISKMPVGGIVKLSLDKLNLKGEFLPSGREISKLPFGWTNYGDLRTVWGGNLYGNIAYEVDYDDIFKQFNGRTQSSISPLLWRRGIIFSPAWYLNLTRHEERPTILQGGKTEVEFSLTDSAFNPTFAFEINKNFNYIPGTFKGTGKNYKFVEEWLPNYFTDSADTKHYGNGLLRIRMIGSGDEAYNMFPIENYDFLLGVPNKDNKELLFTMTLQAKQEAPPGTYELVPTMYRSDKWAQSNVVGKPMDYAPGLETGIPELATKKYIYVWDNLNRITDPYDIDGDGDKGVSIVKIEPSSNSYTSGIGNNQQVTKITTTNIRTWLVDKNTDLEMSDALLYPHQEVGFRQSMEIAGSKGGSDFIGYYHVPKRNHTIAYADRDGNKQEYKSQFDTYLTEFITTTIDGAPVPAKANLQVYYYISPDPTDPSGDDHNTMKELNGGTDTSPNYLTEMQVRDRAAAEGKSIADILKNCTMVKFKAGTITAGATILSSTTLKIGDKEEGEEEGIKDYFSGMYTYKVDGASLPVSYTPLTTMTLLPYIVSGTVFNDKNANSFLDPLDGQMEGVVVELYQTGNDPHTGLPITDSLIDKQTTASDGSYSFKVSYHGEYYLKIGPQDGKVLSLKKKTGGLPYEQSVFQKKDSFAVTDPFTLDNAVYLYQNAGYADERLIEAPTDIYLSVGETSTIPYKLIPDYLMNDPLFEIIPTLISDAANNEFFTADIDTFELTGKKEGEKTITLSIPAAPLDGSTMITKTITVHVEPESVASVSVPAIVKIYAVQGKTNEVIAPELTLYNYDKEEVKAYVENIDLANTGLSKTLQLSDLKSVYSKTEISLNIIPVKRTNQFSAVKKTNLTKVADISGGLLLGTLQSFKGDANWGKFTFDGEYNSQIVNTELEDNRFIMRYRFEK